LFLPFFQNHSLPSPPNSQTKPKRLLPPHSSGKLHQTYGFTDPGRKNIKKDFWAWPFNVIYSFIVLYGFTVSNKIDYV
jgi:hypothetical protein